MQQKKKNDPIPPSRSIRDYLSDIRVIQVLIQLVFLILLVGFLSIAWTSILATLEERGLRLQWGFLLTQAGFQISESPEWYASSSSYGQAFLVGILNTVRVVSIGLVGATILGVFVGIFLLSRNWLIRTISRIFVELLRNTPLLVQLYFWYFVVFFALPEYATPIAIPVEGLARIPIQYPIYIFLFLGVWMLARNSKFPQRVQYGGLIGVILVEVYTRLIGAVGGGSTIPGSETIASLLIGFSILIILASLFASKPWKAVSYGFIIIVGGQVLLGFFAFLAYYLQLLPAQGEVLVEVESLIYMTRKGLAFPEFLVTRQFASWMAFVGLGLALAMVAWVYGGHVTETTGRPVPRTLYATAAIVVFALVGWFLVLGQADTTETVIVGEGEDAVELTIAEALEQRVLEPEQEMDLAPEPIHMVLVERGRFRFERGIEISLEYAALLVGLVIYTAAFIAEIVRAGIQAVPYGQIEAARALGLTYPQTLRQVILPQALRVIIPPLGNQYLNLSKNSSLAVAIAFADTYQVGTTVMNQSGQSLIGFTLVFVVYLSLSLLISLVMNIVNSRFQLVTR